VPDACAPDLAANIGAIGRLIRSCTERPLDDAVMQAALAWNMVVPPEVRGALLAREIDNDAAFARTTARVLVTHGRRDRIVLPSMAEHLLSICPAAVASWYGGVGHMPFAEDAERFDRELAAFVEDVRR
jgi:pimeloyl-ACP methyl ester carboxylesterase